MSTVFIDTQYPKLKASLSQKENQKRYSDDIDAYMAANIEHYMVPGPTSLPVFSMADKSRMYGLYGFTEDDIMQCMSQTDTNASNWQRRGDVVAIDVSNALALRYISTLSNNKDLIQKNFIYTICAIYPVIFSKYYKKIGNKTNPEIMAFTLSDMSNKYHLRQAGSLFQTLMDMMDTAYKLHEPKLKVGNDDDIYRYINDVRSRINNFMRKIANEYFKNYTNHNYLRSEKESFDEEHYHEADSNTYVIERVKNNVVTTLVVKGPNMRIVELAANSCKVSVNELRNYVQVMITDAHRQDISDIVESLLYLFMLSDEKHPADAIGTNEFYIYCMKVYKKSNTGDENIIRIKAILDRWLEELEIYKRTERLATVNNFRRALYTFFVMSIENMY